MAVKIVDCMGQKLREADGGQTCENSLTCQPTRTTGSRWPAGRKMERMRTSNNFTAVRGNSELLARPPRGK
jgi:hypothetical protein